MTGPPSDRAASAFGPEVRLEGGAVEVRRGLGARVALLTAIVVLGVAGALLLPVLLPVGLLLMVASVVPVVALVRASSWQRLASTAGWVHRGEPVPWDLLAAVVLHLAAALWHQLVLRDGTLSRMLPAGRRPAVSPPAA